MQDFLLSNKVCPICQNPLTLFMKWSSHDLVINKLFKGYETKDNTYQFKEYIAAAPIAENNFHSSDEMLRNVKVLMILKFINNECNFQFNSLIAEKMAKEQEELFFYYICNPAGIKPDNMINIYEACYYRATPLMKFIEGDSSLLKIKQLDEKYNVINSLETFTIKDETTDSELKKIYIVYLNYLDEKLSFYYYTATAEQEASEHYNPNIFVGEIPIPKNGLNLDLNARDKLISRMDSWILMS